MDVQLISKAEKVKGPYPVFILKNISKLISRNIFQMFYRQSSQNNLVKMTQRNRQSRGMVRVEGGVVNFMKRI